VVIDTMGGVESVSMVSPISPQYDRLALNAARLWQYQPARVDGAPVKFLKRIQINLVPNGN
jgi:TonB family protein